LLVLYREAVYIEVEDVNAYSPTWPQRYMSATTTTTTTTTATTVVFVVFVVVVIVACLVQGSGSH